MFIIILHFNIYLLLLFWYFPVQFLSNFVHLSECLHDPVFFLQLEIFPVEPQGGHGVLNGVVSDALDVELQEVPGEELEGDPPVVGEVEQMESVDGLVHRNQHVDHTEVILQPVSNKYAATVH